MGEPAATFGVAVLLMTGVSACVASTSLAVVLAVALDFSSLVRMFDF